MDTQESTKPDSLDSPVLDIEGSGTHSLPGESDEDNRDGSYPTISAAVAALSPAEPDPGCRDFDDSNVSEPSEGEGASVARNMREMPLPTPEELAATPRPSGPVLGKDYGEPTTQGDLSERSAISVLYERASKSETGLLVVTCGGIRKELYFCDGVPEFCSSNVAGELFGAYLVNQEAISGGELDMALAMMPHYGGKLGDTLVGLGLMKPLEVFRQLTQQVREKVIDVCTWERGHFQWFKGVENTKDQFRLDIDPLEVLGASAGQLQWPFLRDWLRSVEDLVPSSTHGGGVLPADFKLGPGLGELYNQLSGRKTVNELCRRYTSREGQTRFLRHLYLLLQTGLAAFG